MRLRKSSKWLLLAALVAFASVLQEFPGAEGKKVGGKKGNNKSGSSSSGSSSGSSSLKSSSGSSSSRSKHSRTKGHKKGGGGGSSSGSSSSSASVSVEFGDKFSGSGSGGIDLSRFGISTPSTNQYSKVFKKGPGGGSNKSGGGSNSSSKKGKSKSKNKVTIITPSPLIASTAEEEEDDEAAPTTERLTTTVPQQPTTKRKRVSFGLGHDSGIHASSWIGIDKTSKGVSFGEVIPIGGGATSNFFLSSSKDYRPLERGGLYADGLDLDFAKVYPEDITENPMAPAEPSNSNRYNPVMVGSASSVMMNSDLDSQQQQQQQPPRPTHLDNFIMRGRVEDLEKKVAELERTISTMQKNIEVLQQNTQVISKGFNILSGRVNKVTGDYELVNAKVEDYKGRMEEKIIATEQNVSLALIALQLKTTTDIEDIRQTSLETLGNATVAAANSTHGRNPGDSPTLLESLAKNFTSKMEEWQRIAKNETQLLAEMVKALAEISQGEKIKLENLSNYSRKEIEKLGDILEKQNVEHSHEWDAISTKLKSIKMEVENRDKKFTSDILDVHASLRNATKQCEAEVNKVEESLLEQNMAHNMAHENIAVKIEEISLALEQQQRYIQKSPGVDSATIKRISGAEANITTLFSANKQFLQQFASFEEMNGLILGKITDLRTVHKNDNATTKKDLFEVQRTIVKMEHDNRVILDRLRDLQSRVEKARQDGVVGHVDVGRLGLSQMDLDNPKPTEFSIALQVEIGEIKDRVRTFEENVAELWRSQKQIKDMLEQNGDMVTALQTAHLADHEDVSLQIMEIKIASKMLSEVVRNLSKNVSEFIAESHMQNEDLRHVQYSIGHSNFSSRLGEADKMEMGSLKSLADCKTLEEDVSNLWELSRNISKAQELFLVKLLEMDMEHERDNKTVRQMLMFVMNRTEDFVMQFLTSDERINKILQQFEFTDAEQAKMREELLNIKDRLAASEENLTAVWKASRHLEKGQDELQNNVDNIILVHKTEAKNLTADMFLSKQKLENVTASYTSITERVTNLELLMDIETSKEFHSHHGQHHVNSSEVSKLINRLANSEKDIQELWKSSEILSFQQQVFNEKVRELQTVHENDTLAATIERVQNQLNTQNLTVIVGNMTGRLKQVERYTSPPHESKTIEFEIGNWNEALKGGLRNQQVVYESGKLLDLPSTWRTFVERSGNYISLYNSLVKAEKPVYNEFTVEILDADGRVYSTYGPDMHLYKMNEKIGWSSMISMAALQNPLNKLVTNDALRFRLRTKLFPNGKQDEDSESSTGPSEKLLIQWDLSDIASKLNREIEEDQAFVDLNISKEFSAGHYWGGNTKWKTSLLMREIHNQNYLGINMELLHVDQNWRELIASYNVTLLDAHNRIVKEFSIASNDFKAVSARHSYFMLVKDVLEVLERGDKLTIKIFFDLQARKRSFDVEFIRTK